MMNRLYTALAWCSLLVLVLGILGYRWLQLRRSQRVVAWEFVDEATWKDECYDKLDAHENTIPVYCCPEYTGQPIETETPVEHYLSDSELDFGQFIEMAPEREAGPPADLLTLVLKTAKDQLSAALASPTTPTAASPNASPTPLDQAAQQTQPVFACPEPGCETKIYGSPGALTQVPLPRPSYLYRLRSLTSPFINIQSTQHAQTLQAEPL